jgi:hypothetical protein
LTASRFLSLEHPGLLEKSASQAGQDAGVWWQAAGDKEWEMKGMGDASKK